MENKINNQDLDKSFSTIVSETFFNYKGVVVERLVGGFRIFSHKVRTMDEVDEIINNSQKSITKSITKSKMGNLF